MEWLWSSNSPKKLTKLFDLELAELQSVKDTLSYFKILAKSKSDQLHDDFSNVYNYYLDNCKRYDSHRFKKYETENLNFYVSPFYDVDEKAMIKTNEALESLYIQHKKPKLKMPIDYYMCANEEELNNLSNIIIWNGGLGAYTNIPEGFIVAINENPVYKLEFVHAVLRSSANCFFMQEGIAVLYDGMYKGTKVIKREKKS